MSIPDFDDIIFEKINKEYGAYSLRKRYNHVVNVSIIAACILGSVIVLIPYLIIPEHKNKVTYTSTYITMENLITPVEPAAPKQQSVYSVPARLKVSAKILESQVKYIAPRVVDSIVPLEKTMISVTSSMLEIISGGGIIGGPGSDEGIIPEDRASVEVTGLFSYAEIMPKFKGGDVDKFREWVQRRTRYPEMASLNGIEGKVYVTFIIEKDGTVTNVKLVKGIDQLIDNEALKAVQSSPKWTPGMQQGVAVRVSYIILLNFEL